MRLSRYPQIGVVVAGGALAWDGLRRLCGWIGGALGVEGNAAAFRCAVDAHDNPSSGAHSGRAIGTQRNIIVPIEASPLPHLHGSPPASAPGRLALWLALAGLGLLGAAAVAYVLAPLLAGWWVVQDALVRLVPVALVGALYVAGLALALALVACLRAWR